MEDAPTVLKIPKSECPDIWIRLPKHKWPKSWSSLEEAVVLLERNLHGQPLAGLLWERQFEEELLKHEKKDFSCLRVDNIKLAGKKQNISPTWKIPIKDVDLGEPTSFLDHVYLGCTQRECHISRDIVDNYNSMFESRISAVAMEKLRELKLQGNQRRTQPLHGLVIWKVMQRSAWKDIESWRIKQFNHYKKLENVSYSCYALQNYEELWEWWI